MLSGTSTWGQALRALMRRRRFTVYAVLGLSLGIGFQTAVFSVLYTVLLRPLPIPDADRLFALFETWPEAGAEELNLSYPAFLAWQERSRCFEGLSGSMVALTQLTAGGGPEVVTALLVTPGYFPLLGVPAEHGRTFAGPGPAEPEVVIAHSLWRDRFGADPGMVGRSIQLGESFFTVVGVMPPDWGGSDRVQLWVPLTAARRLFPSLPGLLAAEEERILRVHARLAPGFTLDRARSHLSEIAPRVAADLPASHQGFGVRLVPYRERAVARVWGSLLILQAAGVVVLLIVAVNLANLLLAQGRERVREMAMRAALGASPARMVRQLLTESLVLALLGGALGTGIAGLLLRGLVASGTTALPYRQHLGLAAPVLAVALLVSLLAGVAAGLVPALQAARSDPQHLLRGEGPTPWGRRWRHLRGGAPVLVAVETALTVTLLVMAGLLLRSDHNLQQVELGFSPEGVLALSVSLPGERYPDPQSRQRFYEGAREEIARLPGVVSVAATSDLPLQGTSCSLQVVSGSELALAEGLRLPCHPVTPGYIETLRIPILRGRDLEAADTRPGAGAALLNRRLAELLWPGRDPIGRSLSFGSGETVRVVGVVGDARHHPPDRPLEPMLYLPAYWNNMSLLVRTVGEPGAVLDPVREAIWRVDPRQPIYQVTTLEEVVGRATASRRFSAYLSLVLALFALALGALGLFGVLSYQLSRELRSLAVRAALGAGRGRLLRWILGRALAPTSVGGAAGLILGWSCSRWIESSLYGVGRFDPWTLGAVLLLTLGTALAASYGPSRRALASEPAALLATS